MLLVRARERLARPAPPSRARSYGAGARDPVDRHRRRPALVTFGVLRRWPATRCPGRSTRGSRCCGRCCFVDRLGHLPADRAAAVADDRRPPRARPGAASRCACRRASRPRFALGRPRRRRWPCARPLQDDLFDGSARRCTGCSSSAVARLRGELLRPRLAGRARALRALRRARASWSRCSRALFALAVAVGIASGQSTSSRSASSPAPFVSLRRGARRVPPPARPARRRTGTRGGPTPPRRRPGRRRRGGAVEFTLGHGVAFAASVFGDHARRADAAQRAASWPSTRPPSDAALAGFVFNVLLIARAPLDALPGDPDLAAPPPLRPRARGDRATSSRRACGSRCGDRGPSAARRGARAARSSARR